MILIRRLEHVSETALKDILGLTEHWSYIIRRQMGKVQFSIQQMNLLKIILIEILSAVNNDDR